MATESNTFHLFTSFPTEIQLHILSLAASLGEPHADDIEKYECDPPEARVSLTAAFLRAKIEQYLDCWEGVTSNGWGGGEMDPLLPFIMLLRPTTLTAQFHLRNTELFRDRIKLLWTTRSSRMMALERWKGELSGLKVSDVRSGFEDDQMELGKGRFVGILDELLDDVRDCLEGKASGLGELWAKQEECLRKREEDEYAEIEFED